MYLLWKEEEEKEEIVLFITEMENIRRKPLQFVTMQQDFYNQEASKPEFYHMY